MQSVKPPFPSRYESRIKLNNGAEESLRPVQPGDGDLILDLFGKISPRSLYLRFLSHIQYLSEDMLYRFTHMNYPDEFALAALVRENEKDAFIAVGRYARESGNDICDLALAVRDDWQHLGLGKELLEKLIAAGKENGISRFGSMMDPQNTVMMHILTDLGYEVKYSPRSGFYEVEIIIDNPFSKKS